MGNLEEKTIGSKEIFSGRIITVKLDEVELPNGKTSTREIVKHPGAVAVLAVTDDNKIVMVEQYRKPMEKILVEIPAGKLEEGEDPAVCARRELEEETGYECQEMELLISFYTSPGFADEIVHLYIAKGISQKEDAAGLDEDEFVNVMELTLEEALTLIEEKRIYDAKTAYAVQYVQLQEALSK
ncbi:ADP-ribose pyrophosphatase [Bacillus sp. FJAT-18017]|uniref:NUDIX domain-containing protein n=1 Tax=Bacillus sp. FJAT-18017 TaxID=1705566 RepID=UPI0006AE55A9|nr:NUDIX hydrolase [Bacillus sp. FJAT-18017]ALC90048.1 ADP-ribose pyrophosphatase [Bacillus sp. FJAT-18017]